MSGSAEPPILHIVAHVRARSGHVEAVRDILEGFVAPTLAEDGCLVYCLLQNLEDPAHFTFFEDRTGPAALEAETIAK